LLLSPPSTGAELPVEGRDAYDPGATSAAAQRVDKLGRDHPVLLVL